MYQLAADITRSGAAKPGEIASRGHGMAESLVLQLLGDFRVRIGSICIENSEWDLRKAKNLVKLLALEENFRMHREQIMDLLWPALPPEAAANNLHKALYIARRTLEPTLAPRAPSSFMRVRGDWIQLEAPGGVRTDVRAFAEAARLAITTRDSERCTVALALYSGDLLPEDRYEDWVIAQREHLSALRFDVLLCFARLKALEGRLDDAVAHLQQAVTIDPLNEEAQTELIRLYAQSGHRHLAVQQYKHLAHTLAQELGVEPEAKTRALLQQIVEGHAPPPVPSGPTIQSQPRGDRAAAQALPLFGREAEVARAQQFLDRLCDGEGGLVVVRGEEGIGKSRLATEMASYAERLGIRVVWLCGDPIEDDCAVGRGYDVAPRPMLAIIDDLLDFDLAARTAQRLVALKSGFPVLVLLATRSNKSELRASVDELQTSIAEPGLSCLLELHPLDDTAVELLVRRTLGGRVPHSLIEWIRGVVGGNPHYISEAVQSLVGRGLIDRVDGRWVFSAPPSTVSRDSLRRPRSAGRFPGL